MDEFTITATFVVAVTAFALLLIGRVLGRTARDEANKQRAEELTSEIAALRTHLSGCIGERLAWEAKCNEYAALLKQKEELSTAQTSHYLKVLAQRDAEVRVVRDRAKLYGSLLEDAASRKLNKAEPKPSAKPKAKR